MTSKKSNFVELADAHNDSATDEILQANVATYLTGNTHAFLGDFLGAKYFLYPTSDNRMEASKKALEYIEAPKSAKDMTQDVYVNVTDGEFRVSVSRKWREGSVLKEWVKKELCLTEYDKDQVVLLLTTKKGKNYPDSKTLETIPLNTERKLSGYEICFEGKEPKDRVTAHYELTKIVLEKMFPDKKVECVAQPNGDVKITLAK